MQRKRTDRTERFAVEETGAGQRYIEIKDGR
jgi:hypothetical protein